MGLFSLWLSVVTCVALAGAPVEVWLDGDRLAVSRRVMFKPGHVEFTAESKPVVDALAKFLVRRLRRDDTVVVIEGHSDAGGDEAENVRLSAARAEALCAALARRGVDRSRLQPVGVGSARPLVAVNHPEAYRNRRVELFVRPAAPTTTTAAPTPLAAETTTTVTTATANPVLLPLLPDLPDESDRAPLVSDEVRPRIALLDDEPLIRIPLIDDGDELLPPRFSFSMDLLE